MDQSTVAYGNDTSPADAFVRRVLRLPPDTPQGQVAQSVFGASILLSTVRCLLTYVVIPVLGPVLGLSGAVGPALGLLIGSVSAVAIVFSMRRFWAAGHRLRWGYTMVGGGLLVLLAVQAVADIAALI